MANVQIVETSLRDGNQCLWSALGVDTARSLTIAPVMDRVGFKAIDFTTSTHMGVAVRFKKEDPWERIRLMAKAMPNTPLQFLSTGFRFISWETASPEFMALAFKTLIDNGMRRFALADPMNDADSNVACARMIKAAGRRVRDRRPGLYTESHSRRRSLRCPRPHACRKPRRGRRIYQRPRRPSDAAARPHSHSGGQGRHRQQAARASFALHHRHWRTDVHGCARLGRQRRSMRLGRRRGRHFQSTLRARGFQSPRAGASRGR